MSSDNARRRRRQRKPKKPRNMNSESVADGTGSLQESLEALTIATRPAPKLSHIGAFFAEYDDYSFDPMQPIMLQFKKLARRVKLKDEEFKEARENFRGAVVLDFNDTFGEDENDLGAWQRLCIMLEVSPVPDNIDSCHAELRKIHVNIWDLLEAAMTGDTPKRFPTVNHLRSYTEATGLFFPIDDPRAGGVLRGLLRHLRSRPGVGFKPVRM